MTFAQARVIATREELSLVIPRLEACAALSLDVESDGMFAYRASVCTVQIAARELGVLIVDALCTPLDPLARLLSAAGPTKVVHDVAFDARILAEQGLALGGVRDTAIAARFLGKPATGLAALALAELGVTIDKTLQRHDWRERPLLDEHVLYLAQDVAHLDALAGKLWAEVEERGIAEEVLEETRHRVANALAAAARPGDTLTEYVGAKGADRLSPEERAVLRRLWSVRDAEARARNVPPARLVATEALVALARGRPRTAKDLVRTHLSRERLEALGPALLEAVARGIDDGDVPEEERAAFERPRIAREEIERRRARESALSAWRREEAKRRGVDEQVVLPGHCLKDLAEAEGMEVGTIGSVPGFGACRARYVEAIAVALAGARKAEESG